MTAIVSLPIRSWDQPISSADQALALEALESGNVVLLPQLPFVVREDERTLLKSTVIQGIKNVSLTPANGTFKGSKGTEAEQRQLQSMMTRFAMSTKTLTTNLLGHYEDSLQQARTSFRPVEISGRASSWRKDDTRLHVDNFPSSPTSGKRILRVFSNVNPQNQPRVWRLGDQFEAVAQRYLASLPKPLWGASTVMNALGITKSPRSAYDHYMLRLHDHMKADQEYQTQPSHQEHRFASGTTWMVFTDQVPHAAMSGKFVLEQTFLLPVEHMQHPAQAPLRVLERLTGRTLA
ncbi:MULTISPECIES: Kdo hydroxylase family protein [unclassified Pseudomonas]|uniref:Kdo hydroxylase family protein n=1 Tax=unclassified Pseudomonas TaxID=196821 RepID=UPI002AC89D04|nr:MULTISPECIES: Kdo hydroxylase family protein [unclassified Pseudomonas]MEB0041234.1 Kdo hydroxylase family protein [Pseudomonas sp. MH10]MEB0078323.1 Kdo hydroxylase family protein [Pseudomonas sp. MH10out]MEB0092284.1 Kdo hydroxylase family protein [Pseudomonas sp. CCI4.2]MEB0101777.1 Kdo hydroxylase family protein [Pseudomonas sp. CCI3.2]MEB0123361.1 Kdo hydroxylase family protein [Pseudomonas sp. CCI1.2]